MPFVKSSRLAYNFQRLFFFKDLMEKNSYATESGFSSSPCLREPKQAHFKG
jgi:hypothetical protein